MKISLTQRPSAELVTELLGRTEGWVAGLQLSATAMKRFDSPAALVDDMRRHDSVYVMDYLFDEVLEHQRDDVKDFLLKTALLMRFTVQLAAEITKCDTAGCRRIVDQLRQENLFIVALDSENLWYRYHHQFHAMLADRARAVWLTLRVTTAIAAAEPKLAETQALIGLSGAAKAIGQTRDQVVGGLNTGRSAIRAFEIALIPLTILMIVALLLIVWLNSYDLRSAFRSIGWTVGGSAAIVMVVWFIVGLFLRSYLRTALAGQFGFAGLDGIVDDIVALFCLVVPLGLSVPVLAGPSAQDAPPRRGHPRSPSRCRVSPSSSDPTCAFSFHRRDWPAG